MLLMNRKLQPWYLLIKASDKIKKCSIQSSPARQFSNSRLLFLIFANWRLHGVLDPRRHNSAPLSNANDALIVIHDIVVA